MPDPRVKQVLDNLSDLIITHATTAAMVQYRPSSDPDRDDATERQNKAFVKELRSIRERFEDLMTGILD